MHLETRFQIKEAAHLSLGQGSGPIALDRERFEGLSGQVTPLALQSCRDVVGQIKCDLHTCNSKRYLDSHPFTLYPSFRSSSAILAT